MQNRFFRRIICRNACLAASLRLLDDRFGEELRASRPRTREDL